MARASVAQVEPREGFPTRSPVTVRRGGPALPAGRSSPQPREWHRYLAARIRGEKNLMRFRTAALAEFREHLQREFAKIDAAIEAESKRRRRCVWQAGRIVE